MEVETNPWARRRKAIYFGSVVLVLTGITTLLFFTQWYRAPSCSDGLQNGDETGVDCGGSCSLVCSAAAVKPVTRTDPRLFQVSSTTYSVLAFVDNYNVDSAVAYAPYTFQIYNGAGQMIYERNGATTIPKNQTIAVFEGNINIENDLPQKVFFELDPNLTWYKDPEPVPEIAITHTPLLREDTSPRIEAAVQNKSLDEIKNLELVAVVLDGKDNPIAASRTFVDRLKKDEKTNIFFTWPRPFDLGEAVCERPADVILAIDRSGSMQSLSQNPPEPLTSVRNAASAFADLLRKGDALGVVSFATDASLDSVLSSDFAKQKNGIQNINIGKNGTQFTNIADALSKSFQALGGAAEAAQKIIVLLTDGVATKPADPRGRTEAQDIAYAENAALNVANEAKKNGVTIYTIGLGKDIHADFLRKVASSPEGFLEAPSTTTLESVYSQVSSFICKELPAKIEIKYKIFK